MKSLGFVLACCALLASAVFARGFDGEDRLRERWSNLRARLELRGASGDFEAAFRTLVERYREPHRAYHTLAHVEHVLSELETARSVAEDAEAVELALWYHDVVYDLGSRDNEVESARLARATALELGLGEGWADRLAELILATRHGAVPEDADARLVIDVDLSILGQPPERFDAYEVEIRREYAPVIAERGVEAFNSGRAAILRRFLERTAIYSTDFFRAKYEAAARANLERSIRRLEDPSWTDGGSAGHNRPES